MLPPHELGQKTFTKAMRGYEPAEVDEYIDFLIENYTELYKISDDYDKKLRAVASRLKSIKDDENTIRNAVVSAQKMSEATIAQANDKAKEIIEQASAVAESITAEANKKSEGVLSDASRKYEKKIGDAQAKADVIVSTAQAKSDALLYSAKQRCAKILSEYRAELRATVQQLTQTKQAAEQFRTDLFDSYKTHIDMIKGMVPTISVDLSGDYETRFTNEILEGIKEDAISASEQIDEQEAQPEEEESAPVQPQYYNAQEDKEDVALYNSEVTSDADEDDDVVEYVKAPSFVSTGRDESAMPGQIKLGDMYIPPVQEPDFNEEYIEEYEDEPASFTSLDDIVDDSSDDLEQQAEDYYASEKKKKKKGGFLSLFSGKNKDKRESSGKDDDFSDDQSFDQDELSDAEKKKLDIFQGFDE
ncbi:MAG: DivIVA domain-containing protein [Eubacteriales bacterium]